MVGEIAGHETDRDAVKVGSIQTAYFYDGDILWNEYCVDDVEDGGWWGEDVEDGEEKGAN